MYPPAELTDFHPTAWGQAIDLRGRSFIKNPYPYYSWLRENDPVHRDRNGNWVVTRYADIRFLLESQNLVEDYYIRTFSHQNNSMADRGYQISPLLSAMTKILFFVDAPEHTRLRTIISSAWKQIKIGSVIQDINESIAALADSLALKESFDFVNEYAIVIPSRLTCRLLDLPQDSEHFLIRNTSSLLTMWNMLASPKQLVEVNNQVVRLAEYCLDLINLRRHGDKEDFISRLAHVSYSSEGSLTDDEMVATCIMFTMAGIHTFAPILSNAVIAILNYGILPHALLNHEHEIPKITEEFLRYDTSVQLLGRRAQASFALGDKTVAVDDGVYLCLGSANRDPKAFHRPDEIDFSRKPYPHLSFGHGSHRCLGAAVTRIMMPIALKNVSLLLEGRTICEEISYRQDIGFRIPEHIWLKKTP